MSSDKACTSDCEHNTSLSHGSSGHNPDLDRSYPRSRVPTLAQQVPLVFLQNTRATARMFMSGSKN